jgi:hypothetical protein
MLDDCETSFACLLSIPDNFSVIAIYVENIRNLPINS